MKKIRVDVGSQNNGFYRGLLTTDVIMGDGVGKGTLSIMPSHFMHGFQAMPPSNDALLFDYWVEELVL